MLQVFEIKIYQELGLKELPLHSWRSQRGIAIIWIIAIIIAFAALGSAIVATYNVSLFGQVETGLSLAAESMAESGYRFLFSEYQNQSSDEDKNKLLDEIRFVDASTGKIFNISPEGGGQFQLEMTSYFYRIETVTSGSQLKVRFIGTPGFSVPTTGYLRNIEDDTLYGYGSYSSADDVYTFNLTGGQTVPSTDLYTTVLPAAEITSAVDNGDETFTLTLDSGQGALFPPEKGMLLITREEIKANLPVMQVIPYYYEYRSGDQLFKVTKGPGLGDLIDPTTADKAEVAKFVSLESIGFAPDKANFAAKEINEFQISLDISASSTWHSSAGLKSYWSFDEAGDLGKDDFGTSDGTITGASAGTGKVGGGLDFSGTDYVSTTFNPSLAIGSNNEFTVVFWAKPGTDVTTTQQGVIGVYESAQNFYVGIRNGYWEWGLGNIKLYYDGADWSLADASLPAAQPEEWQHIAFVYDRDLDDVVFYFNGIERFRYEDFTTKGGIVTLPSRYIDLGALYDENDQHIFNFTGSLDELAVFNSALTFCEVNAIFSVPASVPCNVGCDAVAYYPFNGNADDESGTDRNGTYDGIRFGATLTEDRCGLADKAYSFDGNDYIVATMFNPNIVIGGGLPLVPFTVTFWAKPGRTDRAENVFGARRNATPNRRFYIANYYGEWFWGYGNTFAATGSLPVVDEWVHIGYVFDGTDIALYVNGIEEYRTAYSGDGILPNFWVYIGARSDEFGGDEWNFTGTIDEILVWNQDMSSEILNLYNATKP